MSLEMRALYTNTHHFKQQRIAYTMLQLARASNAFVVFVSVVDVEYLDKEMKFNQRDSQMWVRFGVCE